MTDVARPRRTPGGRDAPAGGLWNRLLARLQRAALATLINLVVALLERRMSATLRRSRRR
jgi:hypothetical protein